MAMKMGRNIIVVIVTLIAAGFLKSPWEDRMQDQFIAQGMLSRSLETSVREKIGQTSAAVALGGLRSVVATFYNLKAYGSFENRAWVKLEDQFELMVALQPRTVYYWDVGAWHLSYNAAADYKERENLPAARREALHRAYVLKGRKFLERGIVNNPDQWTLYSSLGRFYGTSTKYPDYAKSAEAYERACKTGKARGFEARAWFYSLARVEGKQKEALQLGRELYAQERHRVDTVRCLLFALEWSQSDAPPTLELLHRYYSSEERALKMLRTYRDNNAEMLPTSGVDHAISLLEKRLANP